MGIHPIKKSYDQDQIKLMIPLKLLHSTEMYSSDPMLVMDYWSQRHFLC